VEGESPFLGCRRLCRRTRAFPQRGERIDKRGEERRLALALAGGVCVAARSRRRPASKRRKAELPELQSTTFGARKQRR